MGSLIGTLLLTMVLVVLAVAAAPLRSLAAEPEAAETAPLDDFDAYVDTPEATQCCRCHAQQCR